MPHDLADPVYTGLDEFRPIRLGFKMFGLELGGRVAFPSEAGRCLWIRPICELQTFDRSTVRQFGSSAYPE